MRSTLTIFVNGSKRRIVCEQGQEEHLQHAGRYLDRRVREMKRNVGAIADSELLVLTALMLVDDLSEKQEQIKNLEKLLQEQKNIVGETRKSSAIPLDAALAEPRLERMAMRMEHLAKIFAEH